jgi:hypothetical protein
MKDNTNSHSNKSALNVNKTLETDRKLGVVERIIIRLQNENSNLCKRLGKMEALC